MVKIFNNRFFDGFTWTWYGYFWKKVCELVCVWQKFCDAVPQELMKTNLIKLQIQSDLDINWCGLRLCIYRLTGIVLLCSILHYSSRLYARNFVKLHIMSDRDINRCQFNFHFDLSTAGAIIISWGEDWKFLFGSLINWYNLASEPTRIRLYKIL